MSLSRMFPMLFMVVLAFTLAACSGGKPESVVEAFYSAAEDGDVEEAREQISYANVSASQVAAVQGKVQMIVGEMQARINANKGLDEVEIVESKVSEDGNTATVRAKLIFNNGKELIEDHRLVKEDDGWKIVLR